jgi:ubiquinone/menaquinone biosynthesis C-methylase UbiE
MTHQDIVTGYDAIASAYDSLVHSDQWMRKVLWGHYAEAFHPGQHILDVSCGTGIDALFLARRGIHVTAIDISPGMLARLRSKAIDEGLASRVTTQVLDFAELATWPPERFDGIISAFAGLNTCSDLAPFGVHAARLLRARGRMIVHMLNRFSLWEWLGHLRHRRWAAARQVGRQRERVFTIGGQAIRHYLSSAAEAYGQFFAPHFGLRRAYSLGALCPPSIAQRMPPRAVAALGTIERSVGRRWPLVGWGRFFVLDLEKREQRM